MLGVARIRTPTRRLSGVDPKGRYCEQIAVGFRSHSVIVIARLMECRGVLLSPGLRRPNRRAKWPGAGASMARAGSPLAPRQRVTRHV